MPTFVNIVRLQGVLERLHVGQGKAKFAFARVVLAKGRASIAAFGGPAADLEEAGDGAEVQVAGHVENRKSKKKDAEGRDIWETQIIADRVTLVATAERTMANNDNLPI